MRTKYVHKYKCERCGLEFYTTKNYKEVSNCCPICGYRYLKYNKCYFKNKGGEQ